MLHIILQQSHLGSHICLQYVTYYLTAKFFKTMYLLAVCILHIILQQNLSRPCTYLWYVAYHLAAKSYETAYLLATCCISFDNMNPLRLSNQIKANANILAFISTILNIIRLKAQVISN